ncbi:unnamed protein product [Leptosia nina]|uniref:Uncharacterized protein n=1 Tax=Leptosia nina TaxID=320188 RepID=A0AAV1K007_9NEOP
MNYYFSLRIKVQNRLDFFVESWLVLLRVCIVACASVYLKKLLSDFLEVQEDTHVWEILYSKLTDYKTFHTLMYTCSDVFDFLPLTSLGNMIKTFLIPYVLFGVVNSVYYWLSVKERDDADSKESDKERLIDDEDSGIDNSSDLKIKKNTNLDVLVQDVRDKEVDGLVLFMSRLSVDPAIFYNVSQMVVYGVMAALVMRLKLLFTTQLCLLSSLVFKNKYYNIYPKPVSKCMKVILVLGPVPMLWSLVNNTSKEMSHIGEERAYAVYKMYGRFSPHELYQKLSKLRATYLIVENKYCYGRSRASCDVITKPDGMDFSKGCSFADIWDVEAPSLRKEPRLCDTLLTTPVEHFYPLFKNGHYSVFRIHDVSVRYMPRSFDT